VVKTSDESFIIWYFNASLVLGSGFSKTVIAQEERHMSPNHITTEKILLIGKISAKKALNHIYIPYEQYS